jgi:hypothetical protein
MRALPEMTDTMIERIADQLDRHCRVIAVVPPEPQAEASAPGNGESARAPVSA